MGTMYNNKLQHVKKQSTAGKKTTKTKCRQAAEVSLMCAHLIINNQGTFWIHPEVSVLTMVTEAVLRRIKT